MIQNSDGKVAMKWAIERRNPLPIQIGGTDRTYTFSPKNCNVFMAWVEQRDVNTLLLAKAKVCNCNNGTSAQAAVVATYLDVLLWDTGSRDGKLDSSYVEVTE